MQLGTRRRMRTEWTSRVVSMTAGATVVQDELNKHLSELDASQYNVMSVSYESGKAVILAQRLSPTEGAAAEDDTVTGMSQKVIIYHYTGLTGGIQQEPVQDFERALQRAAEDVRTGTVRPVAIVVTTGTHYNEKDIAELLAKRTTA